MEVEIITISRHLPNFSVDSFPPSLFVYSYPDLVVLSLAFVVKNLKYSIRCYANSAMKIYKISAVTLIIENMERSCRFYSQIPGFKLVYGGSSNDTFTTFEIVKGHVSKMCLNLELGITSNDNDYEHLLYKRKQRISFGRIIFYTEDVDGLYSYFRSNKGISNLISFENEPTNAAWGERYFHVREPDGYQLSFAKPIIDYKEIRDKSKLKTI